MLVFKDDQIQYNGRVIFDDISAKAFVFLGKGKDQIKMQNGNFSIKNKLESRFPLKLLAIKNISASLINLTLGIDSQKYAEVILTESSETKRLKLEIKPTSKHWNRCWLRLNANPTEKIYGGGEQFSYLNLRENCFPIWTSEPGVGRNKKTMTTFLADQASDSGGDYYTTNFPQASFISSQLYYCYLTSFAYAKLDFTAKRYHEIEVWDENPIFYFQTASSYLKLIQNLNALLGRQPSMPEWINQGAIIGLQGGISRIQKIIKKLKSHHVQISGVWCQDWPGVRQTSFGKRVFWNWQENPMLYPNLNKQNQQLEAQKIKFLAYINPYLAVDGKLYQTASPDYFVKTATKEIYLIDFGEFECATVDLTNPKAFEWFKSVIIKNLIEKGCSGWMADFGEYLPSDASLFDQSDPKEAHNKWPLLWAKCNYEAIKEAGKLGEILFFMRSGTAGSAQYCPLIWSGDQSVNWSIDDGLISTVTAAQSLAMSGVGAVNSDIGGYTSLYGNRRTKELFLRWSELSVFTSAMRTHESNRPKENFQVYDDEKAMDFFARCTSIFKDLTPYRQHLYQENSQNGIPMQRPLFINYPADQQAFEKQYEYMLGQDLLIAPVYQEKQQTKEVYLPQDQWIHLWSQREFEGGSFKVAAPLGQIPVFYRKNSDYADLFAYISKKYHQIKEG
ncbi:alpha-glucosidase [Liquorilactobacillus sicerae]|uniref:alpha-glucosidase n=1 Tax=Liquorilactobacillus sicerae TaxID=1416943 RepID=UPI002480986B|nr:alpha-glucosidase [Liquorilactobacillus sicerae]